MVYESALLLIVQDTVGCLVKRYNSIIILSRWCFYKIKIKYEVYSKEKPITNVLFLKTKCRISKLKIVGSNSISSVNNYSEDQRLDFLQLIMLIRSKLYLHEKLY